MLKAETIRERFRQQWNAAAKDWAKRRNQVESTMQQVTDCMLKWAKRFGYRLWGR